MTQQELISKQKKQRTSDVAQCEGPEFKSPVPLTPIDTLCAGLTLHKTPRRRAHICTCLRVRKQNSVPRSSICTVVEPRFGDFPEIFLLLIPNLVLLQSECLCNTLILLNSGTCLTAEHRVCPGDHSVYTGSGRVFCSCWV